MESVAILLLVFLASASAAEEYYKIKYNQSLSEAVKNDRLLNNTMKCLTNKGVCTAAGLELKQLIPDALTNNCKRCSPTHKDEAFKAIKYLIEKRPDVWKTLESTFDPDGKIKIAAKSDPIFKKYNIQL